MILRRITEHVKAQNWTAVALDFFIVVVGVYMGLQVQEYANSRSDKADEITYLRSLAEDMWANIASLEVYADQREEQQNALEQLALYSDGLNEDLTIEDLDHLVHTGVWNLITFRSRMVTIDEMKSGGKLSLLGSRPLRTRLLELDDAMMAIRNSQSDSGQMYYLFSDPFLVENYDVRGLVHRKPANSQAFVQWLDPLRNRMDAAGALKTRKFQNILLYRGATGAGVNRSTGDVREIFLDIERLINERLTELGAQ